MRELFPLPTFPHIPKTFPCHRREIRQLPPTPTPTHIVRGLGLYTDQARQDKVAAAA